MLDAQSTASLDASPFSHEPGSAGRSVTAAGRGAVHPIEINSADLLQGERELCIRHGSECYRLRHTRNDKLILTK